ncbi:MAG TPA: hypothetical protein VH008_02630, partial [Pseudonocardia sp.]|nr:hypothetical protein [Pseudonocardia sp.]
AFWLTKLLSTAMGESVSDFLGHLIGHVPAVLVGAAAFAAALVVQLRSRRYSTWAYWITVAMVGIFGTMAADVVHGLGVPLPVSTTLYAVILAAVFLLWYRSERTLSIHSIYTRRRELFYWAAVVATFALGTAAGDLTASTFRLGYLVSAFLFILIIAIPAVGYWKFGMNSILAFWFAYVVTRPIGASFADWMAAPARRTGLGWGTAWVGGVLALAVLAAIAYMARTGRDKEPAAFTS